MFDNAVITIKGLALEAKAQAGEATINFTKAELGDGSYDPMEDLSEATGLKSPRQEFGFSGISVIDTNTVKLRTVADNAGVTAGYYISEFGIFADDPDEGEILYSITLGTTDKMDYQPSEAELVGAINTIDTYITVANADSVTITVRNDTYASTEDLQNLSNSLNEKLDDKVDKEDGMGLSQENYTPAEKEKLAGLESSHFKGAFSTLDELETECPTGNAGDFAYVGSQGETEVNYIWDDTDSTWVPGGGGTADTPAQVKEKYESNPDTNAYTDTEKTAVGTISGKVTASGGDISDTMINTFTASAADYPIPAAGDSTKTAFGKVRKFIQDFNNFKTGIITLGQLVNNGTTTEEGFALDARYGKTLADGLTQLNTDFLNATTAQALNEKIMGHALLLDTLDLDEVRSGFYRCYLVNTSHLPPITGIQGGQMGYTLSYHTWLLSDNNTWHGFQLFIDIERNDIYFRTHPYNFSAYCDWKLL